MLKKTLYLFFMFAFFVPLKTIQAQKKSSKGATPIEVTGAQDREFWCNTLYKMASPVLLNLAKGTLKQNLPYETGPGYSGMEKAKLVGPLEAIGRTIAGLAPWLALPDDNSREGQMRKELRDAFLKGVTNMADPQNPDYISFYNREVQPIVDAAYLAHAFIRAPKALWEPLGSETKKRIIEQFKSLRLKTGAYNNWLLFAGMNETFLLMAGEEPDPARIEFARRKITEWYTGDSWYKDGELFSMDYYNSYVIHPMLVDMLKVLVDKKRVGKEEYETALQRMIRHSEFLERIIAPDGSYPAFGRSITYRTAAFQALAQTALMGKLPSHIEPAQVRCGLTAVMHRMYDGNQNFDQNGWLLLGFNGHQAMIADYYTTTGSLYMATLGFLPLGLPANDPFWTGAATDWTSKKAWSGQPVKKDYKVEY